MAFRWAGDAYAAEKFATERYYLRIAAQQGFPPAQFLLATYLEKGRDNAPDPTPALTLFNAAATAGLPEALVRIAQQKNDAHLLHLAAEQGDATAQYRLAQHYAREGNLKSTREWQYRAAEQGHLEACLEVAQLYYEGKEVAQHSETALRFFEIAACQGHPYAQWVMGEAYRGGFGGREKNLSRAVMWYRRAARQGYRDAMLRLVRCYENGEGIAQDPKLAAYWQARADEE